MVAAAAVAAKVGRGRLLVVPAVAAMERFQRLAHRAVRAKAMLEEMAPAATKVAVVVVAQEVLGQMPAGQMAAMAALAFKTTSLVHLSTMQAAAAAAREIW